MEKMKKFMKGISDKLKDAKMYTGYAIELAGTDEDAAELFYKIGTVDLEHAEKMKNAVCERMKRSESENLKHVWAWEKEKITDEMLDVKRMQELYRA